MADPVVDSLDDETPGFGDGTLMSKRFRGFLPVVVECETGAGLQAD